MKRGGEITINLSDKIKNLPSSPGVYLMKDSLGHIIYVGKAKNLKNRVQSYFHQSKSHSPKVKKLVRHLKDFELLHTDTEFEAFMLECRLIQELKPPYNRKMKNPLSYAYIVIHRKEDSEELPRIGVTNSPDDNEGGLYFGPYRSRYWVERTVQGMKDALQISCGNPTARNTACLNQSLGLCMGICLGGAAVEAYKRIIGQIIGLLQGSDTSLLEDLNRRMLEASERFDFEAAAKYRDCIDGVNILVSKEKIIEFTEANRNIAMIEWLDEQAIKLFLIKRNVVLFSEKFNIEDFESGLVSARVKAAVRDCFQTEGIPHSREIGRHEMDEAHIVYSYLQSCSGKFITVPDHWLEAEHHFQLEHAIDEWLTESRIG